MFVVVVKKGAGNAHVFLVGCAKTAGNAHVYFNAI